MPQQDLSLARYFADLPDPRVDRTKKHALGDILVIALCATVAGADSWEEVERFGRAKEGWLRTLLALPNGIPSHDTFYRVFTRLDPRRFAGSVARWMEAVCESTGLRHIAIDGQAVRAAPGDTFSGCLHLVNARAAENRLILGQEAVADGSHEIAAVPELPEVLALKGAGAAARVAGRGGGRAGGAGADSEGEEHEHGPLLHHQPAGDCGGAGDADPEALVGGE